MFTKVKKRVISASKMVRKKVRKWWFVLIKKPSFRVKVKRWWHRIIKKPSFRVKARRWCYRVIKKPPVRRTAKLTFYDYLFLILPVLLESLSEVLLRVFL